MHEPYRATARLWPSSDLILVEGWADLTRYVAASRNRSAEIKATEESSRIGCDPAE